MIIQDGDQIQDGVENLQVDRTVSVSKLKGVCTEQYTNYHKEVSLFFRTAKIRRRTVKKNEPN